MPIATLSEVLQPALKGSYAVGGLVTLGWEDMRAFVAAAEAENCSVILQIVKMAHSSDISCEGEIGVVGYSNGEKSAGTDPAEAETFANETGVDAMAISVGNVHLQENKEGGLDEDRISKIQNLTSVPLVIHGGSGVPVEQRKRLARETNICKFNIGTELRMAFGGAMRDAVNKDNQRFDRVSILKETHDPTVAVVRRVLSNLKG